METRERSTRGSRRPRGSPVSAVSPGTPSPTHNAGAWAAVEEHHITLMGGVPTQFGAMLELLERDPGRYDTSSLRFLFGAGAPVPVEHIRAFERHGLVLKQGFGQTETSILCCLDARDAVRKAGSVGRRTPGGLQAATRIRGRTNPAPYGDEQGPEAPARRRRGSGVGCGARVRPR